MLSFSTCWNSSRHQDGEAMLQEILDLGFERVELGHGIRLSLMEGIQRRFNKADPYLDRARDCLKRVVEYAQGKGVQLGIESRHSYEEIPNEREMATVLNEFNVPEVGYWHDFGHVQVKHNLGFLDHREWLEQA